MLLCHEGSEKATAVSGRGGLGREAGNGIAREVFWFATTERKKRGEATSKYNEISVRHLRNGTPTSLVHISGLFG